MMPQPRPGLKRSIIVMLQCGCTPSETARVLHCNVTYVVRIGTDLGFLRPKQRRTVAEVLKSLPARVLAEIASFNARDRGNA